MDTRRVMLWLYYYVIQKMAIPILTALEFVIRLKNISAMESVLLKLSTERQSHLISDVSMTPRPSPMWLTL